MNKPWKLDDLIEWLKTYRKEHGNVGLENLTICVTQRIDYQEKLNVQIDWEQTTR